MTDYRPPLEDIDFVLRHFGEIDAIAALPGYEHATADVVTDLLAEAGRFFAETVAPLNQPGDQAGCVRHADGSVTTPAGFPDAYRRYIEAGWATVPFDPEYGGGDFPGLVGTALKELLSSAGMAFSMCPLLSQGAIELLEAHGDDALKTTYLPKLVSGEWTGTMCLTEADAGSDLGAIRTRAVRQADGTYRITGTKIFISFGEHDLAENIVHLVLARTPGAPPGTRGISCFVVPKFLPDAAGRPGVRNDVTCVSIEHKLGIKASPTCVLSFGDADGAVGYLVGEEHQGLRAMFTMMNDARLGVAVEGLAVAERASQQAAAYATERRQGAALDGPAGEATVIAQHPDVARMLITMRAQVEAMRRLVYWTAATLDQSRRHPDPVAAEQAADLAGLLTPLAKAWCTDTGTEVASLGLQVHGGVGYIEETGAAQHLRDVRITPIYEGTNGIQAVDLVTRKLPRKGGAVVKDHLARLAAIDGELAAAGPEVARTRAALAAGIDALAEATAWLAERAGRPADVLAGATSYLRLMAAVTAGWLMARSALAARADLAAGIGEPQALRARVVTARFFCEQLLPQAAGLVPAVTAGADVLALDAAGAPDGR